MRTVVKQSRYNSTSKLGGCRRQCKNSLDQAKLRKTLVLTLETSVQHSAACVVGHHARKIQGQLGEIELQRELEQCRFEIAFPLIDYRNGLLFDILPSMLMFEIEVIFFFRAPFYFKIRQCIRINMQLLDNKWKSNLILRAILKCLQIPRV